MLVSSARAPVSMAACCGSCAAAADLLTRAGGDPRGRIGFLMHIWRARANAHRDRVRCRPVDRRVHRNVDHVLSQEPLTQIVRACTYARECQVCSAPHAALARALRLSRSRASYVYAGLPSAMEPRYRAFSLTGRESRQGRNGAIRGVRHGATVARRRPLCACMCVSWMCVASVGRCDDDHACNYVMHDKLKTKTRNMTA